ncbi:hypothetical protein Cfor_08468 [Coptotermes formosanus]|uniref:Uncharacterized protein n=1 Tax=Coptotermes formosanus TaxID=36987 RepID=A0A6L2PDI3_COPFO|nr:hypothetical protein Cfor_08468 [Coptotermes formosanus]
MDVEDDDWTPCSLCPLVMSPSVPAGMLIGAEKGPVKKKQHLAAGENGKHVSIHTVPAAVENECKILSVSEEDLPPTPEDEKEAIKQKFLVEMPEDFYSFWSFCKALLPDKPEEALQDVGLLLVGPFDVLSGNLKKVKQRELSLYLIHWRYYYDPPEFQTIIKGDDTTQFHMGYFRDDPKELPCFVASNAAAVGCTITPMAENIFGAVNSYFDTMKGKCDPFRKMKISNIQTALQSWAKDKRFILDVSSAAMKARDKKVVTKTFHKAGLVVPFNKKTEVGYRELPERDVNLKHILQNVVESSCEMEKDAHFGKLQPIVTAANIANDECDFGTSLELGLDLFCFGGEVFHRTALHLLKTAYDLLQRNEFALIAEGCLPPDAIKMLAYGSYSATGAQTTETIRWSLPQLIHYIMQRVGPCH